MLRTLPLSLALLLVPAVSGAQERTLLQTDVPPVRRTGRTFVPMRAVAAATGAAVAWRPTTREVEILRGGRSIVLRVGSRSATIDASPVEVDVAPFVSGGRVMVPLRFAAEALEVPVRYDAETASVLVGPDAEEVLWVLPLESMRRGIVIHFPERGAELASPVRVHGQANEFEGTVVVQLRNAGGKVLAEGVGTGMMGAFGPFTVELAYKLPAPGTPLPASLVAFAPSPKDGRPLDTITLPVTLK